jgi:hypothetical protein
MVLKREKLFTVNLILNFNLMFKWQISYTEMNNTSTPEGRRGRLRRRRRRNEQFVTVHNKCSKIPQSTSTHLATRV